MRLYRVLAEMKDCAVLVIGKQFLRSTTSVGENMSEAQAPKSAADFIHKYRIVRKGAR